MSGSFRLRNWGPCCPHRNHGAQSTTEISAAYRLCPNHLVAAGFRPGMARIAAARIGPNKNISSLITSIFVWAKVFRCYYFGWWWRKNSLVCYGNEFIVCSVFHKAIAHCIYTRRCDYVQPLQFMWDNLTGFRNKKDVQHKQSNNKLESIVIGA